MRDKSRHQRPFGRLKTCSIYVYMYLIKLADLHAFLFFLFSIINKVLTPVWLFYVHVCIYRPKVA